MITVKNTTVSDKEDAAQKALQKGVNLYQAGKLDEAIQWYEKVLEIQPNNINALCNIGAVLQNQGKLNEAIKKYKKSIAINPDFVGGYNNLAFALQQQEKFDEAIIHYQKAILLEPSYAAAHYNLANTLKDQNRLDEAVISYKRAITIEPEHFEAYRNLGLVYSMQGELADAVASYKKAIAINPKFSEAYSNLGIVLIDQYKLDEALISYQKAIDIEPNNNDAYHNLGLLQLLLGDFKSGWENIDYRWKSDLLDFKRYERCKKILWSGEPLALKRILVWEEQGVGESIIFSSMIPDLVNMGAKVVLECDKRLIPLYSRSFPEITCIHNKDPLTVNSPYNRYDYIVPFGNLCRWLRPDKNSFVASSVNLTANNDKKAVIRNRYRDTSLKCGVENKLFSQAVPPKAKKDILIGISWYSKSPGYGKKKSMTLFDLQPLLDIQGVTFVDLQYGDTHKEREDFSKKAGINIIHDDSIDQMTDLDSFAAQVAAMDMVVTISNTTAHMAGALRVPTLLMLAKVPLWYWLLDCDDSPWYSSLKLYRQDRVGEWEGVVNQVVREVNRFVDKNRLDC
ncbi:MAG: tetratricopeptide repeat protein [Magnetococcales bacterium]|nr:tetratricopeptide repeat protein [Magnetococcales bacterium]